MGETGELFRWLDARLEQLALDAGAQPLAVPSAIPRATLERAGYFEAFPDVAIAAADGDGFLTPAACYHVYSSLASASLDAPQLLTVAATCGRREEDGQPHAGRLERFRMREVVFVGAAAWVEEQRRGWMVKATSFAASLGLAGEMATATDLFFGDGSRGRRLMQQLKNLKYELRLDAAGVGTLAVASFNLHHTFFASRFGIRLADGSPAVSGCAAFGVERWALACAAHPAAAGSPPDGEGR